MERYLHEFTTVHSSRRPKPNFKGIIQPTCCCFASGATSLSAQFLTGVDRKSKLSKDQNAYTYQIEIHLSFCQLAFFVRTMAEQPNDVAAVDSEAEKRETEEYIMVCTAATFLLGFNMGALMNVRPILLDEAIKLAGSTAVRSRFALIARHSPSPPTCGSAMDSKRTRPPKYLCYCHFRALHCTGWTNVTPIL